MLVNYQPIPEAIYRRYVTNRIRLYKVLLIRMESKWNGFCTTCTNWCIDNVALRNLLLLAVSSVKKYIFCEKLYSQNKGCHYPILL